jgi:hypothetical protein
MAHAPSSAQPPVWVENGHKLLISSPIERGILFSLSLEVLLVLATKVVKMKFPSQWEKK